METTNLKQFVRQVSLTVVSYLALCLLLTSAIYSLVGDRPLTEVESGVLIKKDAAARADNRINTLFVGSSVTFRQIDPDVFDASASDSNQYRSYNLGNPGLYPMRSISYLEYLIENPPPNLKYIICELLRLDTVTYNYKSPEIMRITGYGNFINIFQTIRSANFPLGYKFYLTLQYARSLAFKAFGFGMSSYMRFERTMRVRDHERVENSLRGFYSKDAEILLASEPEIVTNLIETRAVLEEKPELLGARQALHIAKYARIWRPQDNPFVDKLTDLIKQADAQGIKLVYLFPPLELERGVEFAYPTFLALPEGNRIDLSDPNKYPEMYEIDNVFDTEHVNSKGAEFLSRYLGKELADLNNREHP